MSKFLLAALVILLLIVGAAAAEDIEVVVPASSGMETGRPVFEWSYKTSSDGEIPETTISLTSSYADGRGETKVIDTIEGECNTYENADADVYENSTMIICYYAGLGRYYKVVESEGSYSVLRKIFEEASPEYDPPQQAYEAVAIF